MGKRSFYSFFAALSLAGYAWLVANALLADAHRAAPTMCLFKAVTGIPCPSCGTTRSIAALARGDILLSLQINPLGLLAGVLLVVAPLWILSDRLGSRDSLYRTYRAMEHATARHAWIAGVVVVLVAANWVWNVSKGL